ncbi:MAG: hypothetical protein EOO90_02695 [Pedobacter sp.]|nr:MAG: hypothetical protein EOO90_02695 [Pedobacter sp.]
MELLGYLVKVTVCTTLFFAFYLVVLRKLTFFKINRFYLLISLLISFTIPLLNFTIEREVKSSLIDEISGDYRDLAPILLQDTTSNITSIEHDDSFNSLNLAPICYGIVVGVLLLLAFRRLFKLIRHTKSSITRSNGLKIVVKSEGFTNCSFFNYVFVDDSKLTEAELAVLIAHEEVHAKQFHSVDKLFMMVVKSILWFNPIVYLYNRALEEAHEYEADELTSRAFTTHDYAALLLRLAINKNQDALVHNFVKNPIKLRIKMLFNSKSNNMKKLVYFLAIPIGLGLIWGFTVKVNYHVKPSLEQETRQQQDTLLGKVVKGKVISMETTRIGEVLNLQVGNSIVPLSSLRFRNKVKVGDEIEVTLGGSISPPIVSNQKEGQTDKVYYPEKTTYFPTKIKALDGTEIYTYKETRYAFLYETNRARSANSKIKAINRNADGVITKFVLHDKYGFTINLNVAAQKFKSNDFKVGDPIQVKFIGEKLTSNKTYSTDKMIALYSQPKKHQLINKTLYDRFYFENGKQKVREGIVKAKQSVQVNTLNVTNRLRAILMSSSSVRFDHKTGVHNITDAVMEIQGGRLYAKSVEMNIENNFVKAKNARFASLDGKEIEAEEMTFERSGFVISAVKPKDFSDFNYNATDSTIVSKDRNTVSLHGNAELNAKNNTLRGDQIELNYKSGIAKATNASLITKNGSSIKAEQIDFDFVKEQYIAKGRALYKDKKP